MASSSEVELKAGWDLCRRGDFEGAEHCCRKVLSLMPSHGGALGLLGVLRLSVGRLEEAISLLVEALQGRPRDAMLQGWLGLAQLMHGDGVAAEAALRSALKWGDRDQALLRMRLGMALGMQGRQTEAIEELRRAQALAPEAADILLNLANAVAEAGQVAEAESLLRRVLQREPDHGDARFNLATLYAREGRLKEAEIEFGALLGYYPGYADVHNSLGVVLERQGRLDAAEEAYRQVLALDGKHISGLNNLGNVLRACGQLAEAEGYYTKAIGQAPGHADGYLNLGMLLAEQERLNEACILFRKALDVDSRCLEAAINLSLTCKDMGLPDEAIAAGRQAVAIAPQSTEAHRKLAHALLWAKQLEEGWAEYEWRLRELSPSLGRFNLPSWRGELHSNVQLLLWNEQGVGDEILYLGLVPELLANGIEVTLEIDKRLVSLVEHSMPGLSVVAKSEPPQLDPSGYTHQSTLASLGQFLRPSIAAFGLRPPYLSPDLERAQMIRSRVLGEGARMLAGLSWHSANTEVGMKKSIDLLNCKEIFAVQGISFLNLQYGDVRQILADCTRIHGKAIADCEDIDLYTDLEGLAAACAACDLVITISSVAAHMAGAMGKPVWLLVPKGKGRFWYWFHGETGSPWYASMRVFEQHAPGDWGGLLAEVGNELHKMIRQ